MIRAFDTLHDNFDVLLQRQQMLTNNMANTNTPGYMEKKIFQTTLKEVRLHNYQGGLKVNQFNDAGSFTFGNEISKTSLNDARGTFKTTGLQTDFAIQNDGFFNVQMPNGSVSYTRNGNFKLNQQNQLTTNDGYLVLNKNNQPINDVNNPDFKITNFNDNKTLVNVGGTYYTSQTNGNDINSQVNKGMLEQSNVQIADQMTDMIQISREYEANQRALSMNNETVKKAVNQLGAM